MDTVIQGFISAMLAVIWRRLYFSLGTLVKSFSYPKKVAEQFLRLRAIRMAKRTISRAQARHGTPREKEHLQQSSLILSEPAGAGSELARVGDPRASRKDERDVQHG